MSKTKYEKALELWGKAKLEGLYNQSEYQSYPVVIDPDTVTVSISFSEGYACCGGSDPGCYCSYAESASCDVLIAGSDQYGKPASFSISADEFDFFTVMRELAEFDV